MTALNLATDIPSSVNTVEKLNVWSGLLLANIFPTLIAVEGASYQERAAQANPFYVPNDLKNRLIVRTSLVLSPDYLIGGAKTWTFVQELGTTAIPPVFRSN
jgi:hypothetical protein